MGIAKMACKDSSTYHHVLYFIVVAIIKMLPENRDLFTAPSRASKTVPGTYQLHNKHLLNVEHSFKNPNCYLFHSLLDPKYHRKP